MLCPPLMRSTLVALLTGIGISVAVWPRSAHAQSAPKSHGPEAQALALYREARELKQAGKLREALVKVQEAYAILPTPTLLWPLAELHARNNEPIEALRALARYRREMTASEMEPGQQLTDVEKFEAQLKGQLAYVRIVAPNKAQVTLDGQAIEASQRSERIQVNPGSHRLVLSNEKGRTESRFEIRAGEEQSVPGAASVEAPGRFFPHPLSWAAVGLTGAAVLTSSVLGGLASSEAQSLASRCPDRLCVTSSTADLLTLNDQIASQRVHATAAKVLIGITVGLAVGTSALLIFDWQRQRRGQTLLGGKNEASARQATATDAVGAVGAIDTFDANLATRSPGLVIGGGL